MLEAPDDTARIAYLALLGAAILASVFFRYRNRMGRALRDATIWLLIILGFVTLYGFKDMLSGGLFPNQAISVGADTVTLRRGRDGHFAALVMVNGVEVDFLVDTGATGIVLTRRDAARVGLDPDRLNYISSAQTANGRVSTAPVVLDEMRLGRFADHDVRATVNGGELFNSLLGMDYLSRYRRYSVEGDTLTLTR